MVEALELVALRSRSLLHLWGSSLSFESSAWVLDHNAISRTARKFVGYSLSVVHDLHLFLRGESGQKARGSRRRGDKGERSGVGG